MKNEVGSVWARKGRSWLEASSSNEIADVSSMVRERMRCDAAGRVMTKLGERPGQLNCWRAPLYSFAWLC